MYGIIVSGDDSMKLYYDRRLKDPTFYIQQGYRDSAGKATTRNVRTIGKYSELLKITDDPLAYAKEEVRKFNEEYSQGRVTLTRTVDFSLTLPRENTPVSSFTGLNIGYMFPSLVYSQLELGRFFRKATEDSRAQFDCNQINRLLTVSRIMKPESKLATVSHLERYYEMPDIKYHDCMRFLTVLSDHFEEYLDWLYRKSTKIVPRDHSVCYYDCTNYYFETEYPDEDYVDKVTGEVMTGLRQYGRSKQHQPAPLVQMGLFMDGQGIPINMCLTPGNVNEQLTARKTEERMLKSFGDRQMIYCADAGLGSIKIRKFNSFGSRAFIVTQSIKKLSKDLQDAVFSDCDYRRLSNGEAVSLEEMKSFDRFDEKNLSLYNDIIFKVIPAPKLDDLGIDEIYVDDNGNTKKRKAKGVFDQHIIVTFSRKSMEYQKAIRDRQVERAEKMISSGSVKRKGKNQNDPRRFITDDSENEGSYEIDRDLIKEEEKYDGFYAIATNLDATEEYRRIIEISSQRYRIEECFRILKTDFRSRPVYESSREHIIGHFMTCYTALLVYRLIETRINNENEHYTTRQIIETLNNMIITDIDGTYYRSNYTNSDICFALNREFGLDLDKVYYEQKFLRKIVKKISR